VPSVGGRIREERERLGLTQSEMADICGIKMRAQRNYEKDERQPDAAYLAALDSAGGDAAYVVTGVPQKVGAFAAYSESRGIDPDLAPDEQLLLEAYRDMKPAKRKALLAELLTGKKANKSEGGVSVKGSGHRVAGRDYNEGK